MKSVVGIELSGSPSPLFLTIADTAVNRGDSSEAVMAYGVHTIWNLTEPVLSTTATGRATTLNRFTGVGVESFCRDTDPLPQPVSDDSLRLISPASPSNLIVHG